MPSEPASADGLEQAAVKRLDLASLRILRLALGTALSLLFSQLVAWPMSFVSAVITMFILALPLPALSLRNGITFMIAFIVAVYAGLIFLPFMLNQRLVGILLLGLALYHTFYFTARGGSQVVGTLATVGLAVVTAIGTVSIDAVLAVSGGLSVGAIVGVLFVWIAHAALPDSMASPLIAGPPQTPPVVTPDLAEARRSAWRSLVIVMPVILWFMLSSASVTNVGFMIKVASMGQQVRIGETRQVARSLIASTVIGGIAAIIAWQALSIYPSLLLYVLLVGLAGLVMGPRIFSGPGIHPSSATWSYAYLTMIIILAPAVVDSQVGGSAGAAFWSRLQMFLWATVYGTGAVFLFDTLWPRSSKSN